MTASVATTRDLGPSPERQVARDLVKHGLIVFPAVVAVGALGWGGAGAASMAFASALVLINFLLNAALIGWAARISYAMVMAAAMFGFAIRLALVAAAVMAVADMDWVRPVPLGVTLVVSHLGLLFWETRYVSASLAFPGLKPAPEE